MSAPSYTPRQHPMESSMSPNTLGSDESGSGSTEPLYPIYAEHDFSFSFGRDFDFEQASLPGYHGHEQLYEQHGQDDGTGYLGFEGISHPSWTPQYPAPNAWSTQPLMPDWRNPFLGQVLPTGESLATSMSAMEGSVFSFAVPFRPVSGPFTALTAPRMDSGDSDSDSDSEEDSDEDSEDGSDASASGPSSNTKEMAGVHWDINDKNRRNRKGERIYECPLFGQVNNKGKTCKSRFVRPEHCRRHANTVHGQNQDHVCKVAQCQRRFSRSDNLRDHYWTHVERGGRMGQNEKMSIPELKALLGKSERQLIKRLKVKMREFKAKQNPAPVADMPG